MHLPLNLYDGFNETEQTGGTYVCIHISVTAAHLRAPFKSVWVVIDQ